MPRSDGKHAYVRVRDDDDDDDTTVYDVTATASERTDGYF